MKKWKILLPILTKEENDAEFLEMATGNASDVVLMIVVDTKDMPNWQFGFAASEIMQGTEFMEELKKKIAKKKKDVKTVTEWGNTAAKICNVAGLNDVDLVILKRSSNQYWRRLVDEIEKGCSKKVEIL